MLMLFLYFTVLIVLLITVGMFTHECGWMDSDASFHNVVGFCFASLIWPFTAVFIIIATILSLPVVLGYFIDKKIRGT